MQRESFFQVFCAHVVSYRIISAGESSDHPKWRGSRRVTRGRGDRRNRGDRTNADGAFALCGSNVNVAIIVFRGAPILPPGVGVIS